MLGPNEFIRYNRQLKMPGFGVESQEKLKNARVAIIGVGGLGCSSSTALVSAGVGHITLVDHDSIELSDLNRQFLYWEEDIGREKVFVAQSKLSKLNPSVRIIPRFDKLTKDNVYDFIGNNQIVIDGTDNLETRLILNSACVSLGIPFIIGGVSRFQGMVTTILPGQTPCLACFQSEGLGGAGILGVIPALISNLQSLEAIKIIIGKKPALAGRILLFNGDSYKFRIYDIQRNDNCTVCSGVLPGKKDK
jgi:molybdopterin/thiamine biosynthesis adenylyltransferase